MTAAAAARRGGVDYRGRRVAFLTQHGKEALLASLFDARLGCRVERIAGFDTDSLGTFTREVPRVGSQRDAARRKARIATELGHCALGLGSEGAFGADPSVGAVAWNRELLVWLDLDHGLELAGYAEGPARCAHVSVGDAAALERFARAAGFPGHALVLRADGERDAPIRKGIASWPDLRAAFARARAESSAAMVLVEHDLRAHCNPTRQATIRRAGQDLVARLESRCPGCQLPGWWCDERTDGLPCAACGAPTREVRSEIWSCRGCGQREERSVAGPVAADPGRCNCCNP